jgi:hypothetical protein
MISSGFTSIATYVNIREATGNKTQIVSEFPLGESIYTMRFKKACFGIVRFKTTAEAGSLLIEGTGMVRVKHLGIDQDLTLELQASFNALRQLGGSYLKIQSQEISMILATLNIRPIEVTARILNPALGTVFHSQIAGPIEYASLDNNAITVKGLKESDSLNNISLISGQPLFRDLAITQEREMDTGRCNSTQLNSLDLEPLLQLASSLSRIVPQGMIP